MAPNLDQDKLSSFKNKREIIKATLGRFETFFNACNNQTSVFELETRLQKVDVLYEEYSKIHDEIEFLDVLANKPQNDHELQHFENLYFKTVGHGKAILADLKAQALNNSNSQSLNDIQGGVKLPSIGLPEYHGSYDSWIPFRDSFNSLVDSNARLSNTQKFFYLKSCLKSEAAQAIQSIEISEANYNIAWGILKDRYENKKLIIHSHVQAIFNLSIVKEESFTHLRKLLDSFNKHLRSLKSLGEPTDQWDTLLIYILTSKLDSKTKREWEEFSNKISEDDKSRKITSLTDFLAKRCQLLETLDNTSKFKHMTISRESKVLSHLSTQKMSCSFCKQGHFNAHCDTFAKKSVAERYDQVKRLKLCWNCLRPHHFTQDCRSSNCKKCNRKHHTLLHSNNDNYSSSSNSNYAKLSETGSEDTGSNEKLTPSSEEGTPHSSVVSHSCVNATSSKQATRAILATVVIFILDSRGKPVPCRAMLDSGSQINFITSALAKQLNLKTFKIDMLISGVNDSLSNVVNNIDATILSKNGRYKSKQRFLIINKITEDLPQTSIDISSLNIPSNLELADENFYLSDKIDMLLGASVFFNVLTAGKIEFGVNYPILQNTKFGWILSGPSNSQLTKATCNLVVTNEVLHKQIEKFWELDTFVSDNTKFNREEKYCEEHFINNTKRDAQGRFQVCLPLCDNYTELGDSQATAINRFYMLEKRFLRDSGLKREYVKFINEYRELGHMSLIENENDAKLKYYMPHHGILKQSSTTTKLRVVFDASCKSSSGLSLNDVLMVGPTIQPDLFSIAIKFRKHNVVFTGDIEKMYRQVNVQPNDRDLQRIVWRADSSEEIKHFSLNTVTYGTASAAFLAVRALQQAAIEYKHEFPHASSVIKTDFYVDDLITGANSVDEALTLKSQIIYILSQARFNLRKFASNSPELLDNQCLSDLSNYSISDDKTIKTLGLVWNPRSDTFTYDINVSTTKQVSKRFVLSVISKIFDPLGYLCPVIVQSKLFLQRLWQIRIGWDDPLPVDLHKIWAQFYSQISEINNISLPRQVTIVNHKHIEIHGYCDASEVAYGACIYVRTIDSLGTSYSNLLCAKSRVSPLKQVTLPRLELCGALLLAKLLDKIKPLIEVEFQNIYLWSDSTIVLAWISAEPNTWKTFIANRVAEIQELTNQHQWRHVPTSQNPADIISRGANPNQLRASNLWFHGSDFLTNGDPWPNTVATELSHIPDKRKIKPLTFFCFVDQSIFQRFSHLSQLQRVFAYMLRFINNCRSRNSRTYGYLTAKELNMSLRILIKMVQSREFKSELSSLNSGKLPPKGSKLLSLNVFLDDSGLLRVGGRLVLSDEPVDKKHPILIPSNHALTKLIIEHEHKRHLHSGVQTTLAAIRNKFWPLNGKNAVKGVLRKCVLCFKFRPSKHTPLMGNLPKSRIAPARPFSVSGIDFAGPIHMKDGSLRCRKIVKVYFCVFVCFTTKAVHLELVQDLSTDSFLNCLKRFVSRRGICKEVHSDNATNFKGANNELKRINNFVRKAHMDKDINEYLSKNQITWHFSPPRSPHFGGLWEAAVKSAKNHLLKVIKNAHFTYENLYTILCQVESILNSRPLTPLSNDPNDLSFLTPGHFLIGDALTNIPQHDVSDIPVGRLKLYHRMQQVAQHFWRRWSCEYLTSIQQRTKWQTESDKPFKLGSLVLLIEENFPPQCWKTGRITAVHPGKDGTVRVVSVKTSSGVYKRAVTKLCILPMES